MTLNLKLYVKEHHPLVVAADGLRLLMALGSPLLAYQAFQLVVRQNALIAPLHRQLWHSFPSGPATIYAAMLLVGIATCSEYALVAFRNLLSIALARLGALQQVLPEALGLPPYPYTRESFALILGEIHSRDGRRVPNAGEPNAKPRWLILPELALYTGVFVTGAIGTGKTSAVAYPALKQLIGFRREVRIRRRDGSESIDEWKFSGLILDEKGDFTRAAAGFAKEWGREKDLIRISPGGDWIWNVIYNPNLPAWAVAYQLGWIVKNFNKGQSGSDPFWENAPKELITEYLGLLDDADGYYTMFDFLEVLIDNDRQDALNAKAQRRFANDPVRLEQCQRRWKAIERRRTEMSVNLRGSLEACAKAGMDMFRQPELRRTFCPTKEEYFERGADGKLRPRSNVFVGFDQALEEGKLIGLEMPKQIFFDAAVFCQVALKSQWQDSVLRRDTIGPNGKPLLPPKFGERIGYCPTFLMADEAQISATPKDGEFKAVCRSKRASMWELTQSHSSIKGSFGQGKEADAAIYFQNSMTHIYLRQSDLESMKGIQEQIGKKIVQKTTLAISEGGNASELSYFEGQMIHEGLNLSSTKTVATEEKPFMELEELKSLPNNVAVVTPSNGDQTLPATIAYLRPLWVFKKFTDLKYETSWFDWPNELKSSFNLENIPQEHRWKAWDAVDETETVDADSRLGQFVQDAIEVAEDLPPPEPPQGAVGEEAEFSADDDKDEADDDGRWAGGER